MATEPSHRYAPTTMGCTTIPGPFPSDSTRYDDRMVTVIVGENTQWLTRMFTVHESLLELASASFQDELDFDPLGSQKELPLPDDSPMGFEVLYHWMYSGLVYDHEFYPTGSRTSYEMFWTEVYIFAKYRLLHNIQKEAFRRLCQKFNSLRGEVPSRVLLEQLFEPDCDTCGMDREEPFLKNYFLEHTAFWLVKTSKTGQRALWERLLEYFRHEDGDFAAKVAFKLADWASDGQPFSSRRHPGDDPAYIDCEIISPPNAAVMRCTPKHDEARENCSSEEEDTSYGSLPTQTSPALAPQREREFRSMAYSRTLPSPGFTVGCTWFETRH
jgi:hypothetical protein